MELTFGEPLGGYEYRINIGNGNFDGVADVEKSLGEFIENLDIGNEEQYDLADMIAHYCELREKSAVASVLEQAESAAGISWRDIIK